jgi:enterochelin esterase-like enzyme
MDKPFIIPSPKPGPFVMGQDSQRHPEVPRGTVTKHSWRSTIFPGTVRDYFVYVPVQYSAETPANLMVFQDGGTYVKEDGDVRAPVVFDNLIHQGKLKPTIGVFVNPGFFPPVAEGKDPISNRSFEYDTLSDQYARFLLEEILPEVAKSYRFTEHAEGRAIGGASSGGICAWTVAWERPESFSKVLSHVGSFANIRGGHACPFMIRKAAAKPIRVYLQAGSNDLNRDWGNWLLGNLQMASALELKGYDYHLEYGVSEHNCKHGGAILPESLLWLWR